jgi:hypothetical protein
VEKQENRKARRQKNIKLEKQEDKNEGFRANNNKEPIEQQVIDCRRRR